MCARLGLILAVLGVLFAANLFASEKAAIVNGEAIPLADIEAVIQQRPTAITPLTPSQQKQLRLEILSGLIDDVLLRQFLRQHGPKIDPGEVDRQLAALRKSLTAQEKTFAEFLNETNQTEAQVRENMEMMLRLAAYVDQNTTEAQLREYYQKNKAFFDKITVRASHIVLRVSQPGTEFERRQLRAKLAELRKQILEGKLTFEEAAQKYSHCPSAPKGGDIGYFTRKWMLDDRFAETAFSMKVGDVSEVVETDFGLHLIKVTDRTKGSPSKFEQVKAEVRDTYSEDVRQQLLEKLRKSAKVQILLE